MNPRRRTATVPALLCVLGVALVIAPLPVAARAAIALPIALVVPGLAVTRMLGVRDRVLEVVLAFPISAALLVLTAQAALYLHAWSPAAGMVVLLAGSGALLWRSGEAPSTSETAARPQPSQHDVLFGPQLRVFALAEKLGNVSAACRLVGVDRSTYYRWKRRLEPLGDGGRRRHATEPGERVELGCSYVGRLARAGGSVWQYAAIDVASGFAWAELRISQRSPRAGWTHGLVQRVARELKAAGFSLQEVATDNGSAFRPRKFSDAVERLGARRRVVTAGRLTGVQRLQLSIVEECWTPLCAGSPAPNVGTLQRKLDKYIDSWNLDHLHGGRVTNGHMSADIVPGARGSADGGSKYAVR